MVTPDSNVFRIVVEERDTTPDPPCTTRHERYEASSKPNKDCTKNLVIKTHLKMLNNSCQHGKKTRYD